MDTQWVSSLCNNIGLKWTQGQYRSRKIQFWIQWTETLANIFNDSIYSGSIFSNKGGGVYVHVFIWWRRWGLGGGGGGVITVGLCWQTLSSCDGSTLDVLLVTKHFVTGTFIWTNDSWVLEVIIKQVNGRHSRGTMTFVACGMFSHSTLGLKLK